MSRGPPVRRSRRLLEPGEQRLGREQLGARGGKLDREREAVEADADLGDRRRVRVRDGEVGLHGAGALDEERDRLVLRERRDLGQMRGVGQVERRHRELVLAGEVHGDAARDEQLQLRRSREQVGERGRRLDEVLEVVEDEQQPLLGEEAARGSRRERRRRSP